MTRRNLLIGVATFLAGTLTGLAILLCSPSHASSDVTYVRTQWGWHKTPGTSSS